MCHLAIHFQRHVTCHLSLYGPPRHLPCQCMVCTTCTVSYHVSSSDWSTSSSILYGLLSHRVDIMLILAFVRPGEPWIPLTLTSNISYVRTQISKKWVVLGLYWQDLWFDTSSNWFCVNHFFSFLMGLRYLFDQTLTGHNLHIWTPFSLVQVVLSPVFWALHNDVELESIGDLNFWRRVSP